MTTQRAMRRQAERETRRGKVYGYLRMSTSKQVDSPEVQRGIIEKQAAHDGLVVDEWILDAAISAKVPLDERPGGKDLCNRLRSGDHVYVAKLDRAFRRAADCAVMMDKWHRLGVNLTICNLMGMTINLASPIGRFIVLILAAVAELEREFTRERTRDGLADRKRKGQACGKYAGYGFKWEKRWDPDLKRYAKHRVSDTDERRMMAEIVKWRLSGHTWEVMRDHLRSLGITTKEGKPWDENRLRRAFMAELKLQQHESRMTDK